jgi:phosphoglycerate kinase
VPSTHASLEWLPRLKDLGDLEGRRVLVRTDFNVPLGRDEHGQIIVADDFRIRAALPTLEALLAMGATVVCCSHLGRPSGPGDASCRMDPVRAVLAELCPGVELLDNLRYEPGEKANDPAFVARLIAGFDAYVNEAFGVSHRAHASIVGPPRTLPSAAGRRLAEEVEVLTGLLADPARPFVAVLGGAKLHDKLGVVASLAKVADTVLVGGAMAFTFLAATGRAVGDSLVDPERVEDCRSLLDSASTIKLPSDVLALSPGATFAPGSAEGEVASFDGDLPDGWCGLDIGAASAATFAERLLGAATILWNGPMGAFEDERFAGGTRAVAKAAASSDAYSVVGGGDSARALAECGCASEISFVSTGGGASLAFLEHGDLPGLDALRHAPNARGQR